MALLLVDAHNFIEQAEVVAALAGHGAKSHQIFREAGAAVTDSRIQEALADTSVRANALANLLNVGSHALTNGSDGIDERNLHCEKSIGCMFDQFGTLGTGNNERRRELGAIGTRDGIGAAIVSAVRKRRVDFAQH